MGQTEQDLAKKLAVARKARIREEGIASLKSKLKSEKKAAFDARFGGVLSSVKSAATSLKGVADKAAKQQGKKKANPFAKFNKLF